MGPTLPVASELVRRGHEVGVLTHDSYRDKVERLGLTYLPTRAWHGQLKLPDVEPARTKIGMMLRNRRNVTQTFLPSAVGQASDIRDALRDWKADVLIGNEGAPGVGLVGERLSMPWATHGVLIQCLWPSRDLPTWGMNGDVPRTDFQRKKTRVVNRIATVLTGAIFDVWNDIRRNEGLPERRASTIHELITSPHLYTVPSTPDFDYPRGDLPPHVHYVGPCLPLTTGGGTWENPFSGARPLVYGTAGTVANHPRFHRLLAEAATGERYDLFLTLGHENDPALLDPLPPNIRAARFVPQHLIFPHASLLVSNGSDGSVMGALLERRPVVLLPQAGTQPETSRRCVEAGVGVIAGLGMCTPVQMRRAIRKVLDDPSYRASAERVGNRLALHDGPSNAANKLEELARTGAPSPPS